MKPAETVIVGAGTAGCVVARRLIDAGHNVTILEAGPGEPRPPSILGLDTVASAEEPSRQWPGLAVRSRQEATPEAYRQGFGVGGGSAINALILAPGDRADYDRWQELHGCEGWSAVEMAPWFDRALAAWPIHIPEPGPVTAAFCSAAIAAGHPIGGRTLDHDRLGVLDACLAADGSRRRSAFDQHLAALGSDRSGSGQGRQGQGRGTGRWRLRTNAPVGRITVDGSTATGVELVDGSRLAADRVILCAGAIQSPRLLEASGLVDRPVGQRLLDHPSFVFTIKLRRSAAADDAARGRTVSRVLRWSSAAKPGPAGTQTHTGGGDLQAFVLDRVDDGTGEDAYAVVVVGLMDVASVGRVLPGGQTGTEHAESSEPAGSGRWTSVLGTLTDPDDRRRMRRGVQHVQQLLTGPEFSELVDGLFIDDRGTPATELTAMSDDEFDRWLIDHRGPYAHPAGSCPMGPIDRTAAVVSHRPEDGGRLHGANGVHVIDASILPNLVSGGLQLPVLAMAERLAAGLLT